ncbi:hypothetical protein [Corynebacterium neomassiliense]|uniref:hypothetical protein n=1 Tax=Corynebacterium neomassiliense TaxID=2079482 RepID=UPI00103267A5|nr:hypothetical protein [Corynebacterium neomassiliense]
MAWTPHDLPHLVSRFGAATAARTRLMQQAFTTGHAGRTLTLPPPSFHQAGVRESMITGLVTGCPLYWMDAEVCALLRTTAPGLPAWSPEELLPAPHGIIAFENEVVTYPDPDGGRVRELTVDAVGWQIHDGQVTVHALSLRRGARTPHDAALYDSLAGALRRYAPHVTVPPEQELSSPLTDVLNFTVGVPDTVNADGSVSVPPGSLGWSRKSTGPEALEALEATALTVHCDLHARLLRVLGATWALLRQRDVLAPGEPVHTHVRVPVGTSAAEPAERAERAMQTESRHRPRRSATTRQQVQVRVYRLSPSLREYSGGPGHGPAVRRWWVRGHWRRQPWGRRQSRRKLVYILPHTAGARGVQVDGDGPDDRPSVTVVKL